MLKSFGELDEVELAGVEVEVEFAARGLDVEVLGAGLGGEEVIDQPHTANAGDALDGEGEVDVLVLGRRDEFVEPGVVAFAQGLGVDGREGLLTAEVVELVEALLMEEVMDIGASKAAVVGGCGVGGDGVAAMKAVGHGQIIGGRR